MGNERKLRLIQVAKEFKVGLNTVTDFLQKKGIKSDGSPNTLVDAETYAVLEKEFGANRSAASARDSIRERISLKQTTVTLEEARKQEREEEKEVVIKSNVISVKDEIQQPKFLGKIDLSPKPKAAPAPQPKPAPEAVKPAPQPAAPAAKAEEAPKAPEAVKPAPAPAPAPQPKPAETPKPAAAATPAPAKAAAPVQEAPKRETPAPAPQPKAAETPAPKPAPAPAAPAAQAAPAPAPAAEPKPEAPKDNIFRPETVTLTGPQVLGTMDVSGFVAGGKHKRKRLQKEKVDVSKAPKGNAQGGGNRQGQGGQNNNGNRSGGQGQNRGGGQNQPRPGEGRRNKGKNAPKPIVRPEVSDEEVSKQVKDTLARLTAKGSKSKSSKYRKDKREAVAERMNEEFEREEMERSTLKVTEFVTVSELATMMNVAPTEVIMACMNLGLMVSINQRLDAEALVVVAEEFGYKTEFVSVEIQEAIADDSEDREEDLVPRPPIVTVMGHVDHGKTSLLDNIRKTNVIEGEAGGITQHIGAYSVVLNGQKITFLDTPGHEAFTAMRARGAAVTDVAIIIVAADDSVMPQTVEAINHAQAAGVPMVFAINKIDKPNANPDHIKEQLSQMNYLVESWGGKYQDQEVSAKKGLNLDKLLEKVLLEAEMLDLKANPNKKAQGTVIESTLDKGRGYVSTILVQSGTLRVGDVILSGTYTGRVKAMFNENGKKVEAAGPSTRNRQQTRTAGPHAGHYDPEARDARRDRPPHRHRLVQGAEHHRQGRRGRIGRGHVRIADQALEGDRAGQRHPRRRRTDFGVRRAAGRRLERHHRRLPGASVGFGPQAGREGGDRNPPLLDHLRRHQRHQGRHRGHARTGDEGGDRRFGRSARNLQDHQGRNRRRMYGPRRQAATLDPDPRHPRRHRDLHRQTRLAQTFQGRRQGGRGRTGLRSEHRVVQRHPRRRHRRRIRTGGSETQVTHKTNNYLQFFGSND